MDRRRLEDAHFQFAILQVASWYPQYTGTSWQRTEHTTGCRSSLPRSFYGSLCKLVSILNYRQFSLDHELLLQSLHI